MSATFTLTPEQLALQEVRRLKKDKAATSAGAASSTAPGTLVNNEKGQIVPRPWLALQDSPSPTNGTRPVKIMTWNVRRIFFSSACVHSVG
jgi:hypothetical protein